MEASAKDKTSAPLVERYFTEPGWSLDSVGWGKRDVWVGTKYEHLGVEAPIAWTDNAVAVTSKLYLSKAEATREDSVKDLIRRIAAKIALEAGDRGYFGQQVVSFFGDEMKMPPVAMWTYVEQLVDDAYERILYDELCYILVRQLAVFNSPVLFNVGRSDRNQQVSACFILSLDDTTKSIKETSGREIDIFRGGSGSGFDVSRLRGSMEPLSTGGRASGPVSFMRLWDAGAGTFKSGGVTRRAAKLVKMDADHPDIRDFIVCKKREEERLHILAESGMNISMDEEGERNVAESTSFQNANNSVGVTDRFMRMATSGLGTDNTTWPLIARKNDEIVKMEDASELLDLIADSAHYAACPGMFFMDAINKMHTAPMIDGKPSPIRSSNPCGEFLHNDDTSCNLGSVNVLKFANSDELNKSTFDTAAFRHVVDVMALSMEVCVAFGYFPDEKLAYYSQSLRPLGLGYSNMGAAIMSQGLAYDSEQARDFAASVTALLTGRVYRKSAQMAQVVGPFAYFAENRDSMLSVLGRHHNAIPDDQRDNGGIWDVADYDWRQAISLGIEYGFRNSQATVIPPAGTTSYFLDCDTTGIEPAFELEIHKDLAGGGSMTILNKSVDTARRVLGCRTIDEAKATFPAVFATANEISPEGHLKMMGAVQPFVSGAISKTINMATDATVQDVRDAYVLAWQLGLKDVAIYRNGSKARQPHSAKAKPKESETKLDSKSVSYDDFKSDLAGEVKIGGEQIVTNNADDPFNDKIIAALRQMPEREKLPRTRKTITHKIHIRGQMGDYEGYVHLGTYPDGRLGEMFVDGFGRAGSFTLTALASWAQSFSIAVQYGVPWEKLCRKNLGVSDETGGMVVPNGEPLPIRSAKSIFDYIARYIAYQFGDADTRMEFGVRVPEPVLDAADATWTETQVDPQIAVVADQIIDLKQPEDMPTMQCNECGSTMRQTGGCWTCTSCFNNTGCG